MNNQNSNEALSNRGLAKMHINPHFNKNKTALTPHINPNFYQKLYGQASVAGGGNIHVNPKFVNSFQNKASVFSASSAPSTSLSCTPLQDHNKQNVCIGNVHSSSLPTFDRRSKYKLINVKPEVKPKIQSDSEAPRTSYSMHKDAVKNSARTVYTGPIVKTSKYSLVRNTVVYTAPSIVKTIQISRYKSIPASKLNSRAQVISFNKNVQRKNLSNHKNVPKQSVHRKLDRRVRVPIKSKLGTSTSILLNKSTASLNKSIVRKRCTNLITIRGQKFSATRKSLKLISAKSDSQMTSKTGNLKVRVNGKVYVQKSQNLFVRKRSVITDQKLLTKNNIPCPLFRKFGKCLRSEKGNCPLLHDKKHIALCRTFLKGTCKDSNCLLSHQVSVEKMPTCSFYLQGCCTRDECPYLHVKLGEAALICTDFLKGYCVKGDECTRKHIFLCPDFAKSGKCIRNKCHYPHKRQVDSICGREPSKLAREKFCNKKERVEHRKADGGSTERYYARDETKNEIGEVKANEIHTNRCRLGNLPSYIKL